MKNWISFLGGFAILCLMTLGACNGDDDDGPSGFTCTGSFQFHQQLAEEAQAWSEAAQTYGQNPTTENCEAYKAAARDYLEEAKKYKDCAYQQGQGEEYEQGIEDAEESIDDLEC